VSTGVEEFPKSVRVAFDPMIIYESQCAKFTAYSIRGKLAFAQFSHFAL